MPLITKYKVEEHTWTTGYQLTEQTNHGYRVVLRLNNMFFYTNPVKELQTALALIKILEDLDGK